MRLSDFKDEEALDLIADLIEPVAKIASDEDVQKAINAGMPKLLIAKAAIKNQKAAVIEGLAVLHQMPVEEYTFTAASLIKDVLDFLNDPVLTDLFTSQGQEQKQSQSSGSAMENTEVEEK